MNGKAIFCALVILGTYAPSAAPMEYGIDKDKTILTMLADSTLAHKKLSLDPAPAPQNSFGANPFVAESSLDTDVLQSSYSLLKQLVENIDIALTSELFSPSYTLREHLTQLKDSVNVTLKLMNQNEQQTYKHYQQMVELFKATANEQSEFKKLLDTAKQELQTLKINHNSKQPPPHVCSKFIQKSKRCLAITRNVFCIYGIICFIAFLFVIKNQIFSGEQKQ